jgi:hypothetical protein
MRFQNDQGRVKQRNCQQGDGIFVVLWPLPAGGYADGVGGQASILCHRLWAEVCPHGVIWREERAQSFGTVVAAAFVTSYSIRTG